MSGKSDHKDIAKLSFEDALAELQELVKKLERGEAKLEEAILAYERGAQLKAHCEAKLRDAQMKVEKIMLAAGELAGKEPAKFD